MRIPKQPSPNHALQRTPGFGVQLPSAAVVRPAQSGAVLPAMKPGTARAFASRRRAHTRVPGPESLSLGSLGVASRTVKTALIVFLLCLQWLTASDVPRAIGHSIDKLTEDEYIG